MKIYLVSAATVCAIIVTSTAYAGRVSGGARADFSTNNLIVPCVLVENYDGDINGKYFDIILDRQGDSFAFELSFAEAADPAMCETLSNFSIFIDNSDSEGDDNSPTSEKNGVDNLFVKCEVGSDRSKASIDAKNIAAGEYYAVLTSGENRIVSATKFITGSEVEFDFDSEPDYINEGSEILAENFIQDNSVTGKIFRVNGEVFNAASNEVALGEPVSCLIGDR